MNEVNLELDQLLVNGCTKDEAAALLMSSGIQFSKIAANLTAARKRTGKSFSGSGRGNWATRTVTHMRENPDSDKESWMVAALGDMTNPESIAKWAWTLISEIRDIYQK